MSRKQPRFLKEMDDFYDEAVGKEGGDDSVEEFSEEEPVTEPVTGNKVNDEDDEDPFADKLDPKVKHKCTVCQKSYVRKAMLEKHMKDKHGGESGSSVKQLGTQSKAIGPVSKQRKSLVKQLPESRSVKQMKETRKSNPLPSIGSIIDKYRINMVPIKSRQKVTFKAPFKEATVPEVPHSPRTHRSPTLTSRLASCSNSLQKDSSSLSCSPVHSQDSLLSSPPPALDRRYSPEVVITPPPATPAVARRSPFRLSFSPNYSQESLLSSPPPALRRSRSPEVVITPPPPTPPAVTGRLLLHPSCSPEQSSQGRTFSPRYSRSPRSEGRQPAGQGVSVLGGRRAKAGVVGVRGATAREKEQPKSVKHSSEEGGGPASKKQRVHLEGQEERGARSSGSKKTKTAGKPDWKSKNVSKIVIFFICLF